MSNNDSYYNKILGESFELAVKNKNLKSKEYNITKENELLKARVKELEEQLALKTQECEELKRKVELMMDCPDCKVDEYKKALEEIEKLAIKTNRDLCNNCGWVNTISCIPSEYICGDIKQILDIINKAKGEV